MNYSMVREVFTVDELAQRWRCRPLTVYRMIESGRLDVFRIGNAIRIARHVVESYERGE